MNDSRVFVDTNIFLYATLEDDFLQDERARAINLLTNLSDKTIYINTQVLNEFYSVMLRRSASEETIHGRLNAIIAETKVSVIKLKTIKQCWNMRLAIPIQLLGLPNSGIGSRKQLRHPIHRGSST